MNKITYLGALPLKCGSLAKDIITILRKIEVMCMKKKLNSENKQISNYVSYCGNPWS